MISPKRTYRRHFKRDHSVKVRLTDRDIKIIFLVYHHRFINSDQITRLVNGGKKSMQARLGKLYHAGYLDRPKSQLDLPGNNHKVYALGNKGADMVCEQLGIPLPSVDWTSKNREVKKIFLAHRLGISQLLTASRLACQNKRGVSFIEPEEIIDNRPTLPKGRDKALSFKVKVPAEISGMGRSWNLTVIPDTAIGLLFRADGSRAFFFVEIDRATMPIKRSTLMRTSYYKKLLGYFEGWRQGLFKKTFGFKNPRILTVTTSYDRIESMINAQKDLDLRKKGFRMFLFTTFNSLDLDNPKKIFRKICINGRAEKVSLID